MSCSAVSAPDVQPAFEPLKEFFTVLFFLFIARPVSFDLLIDIHSDTSC
jgi:hypothetical protein